jgi:hypothetical protein
MLPLYLFCETEPSAADRKESLFPGNTGRFRRPNAFLCELPIFGGTPKVKRSAVVPHDRHAKLDALVAYKSMRACDKSLNCCLSLRAE